MSTLLLRFALIFCPREFRGEYRDQLAAGFAEHHPVSAALDVLWTGITLHAENLARDLAFAFRTLRKAPLFVSVAILAIALAIGANVAVATMIEGILLKPLPFPNADRLVALTGTVHGSTGLSLSYADAQDYLRDNRTLTGISLMNTATATMTGAGAPVRLPGALVNAQYFDVLQIRPEIGRFFTAGDLGKNRIVISDDLWRRRFDADSAALGRTVQLDGKPATIVGVAPPKFANPLGQFFFHSDYWSLVDPAVWNAHHSRGDYTFAAFGRLRSGVGLAAAQADLTRVAAQIIADHSDAQKGLGIQVQTMADEAVGSDRGVLFVLYASVLVVFLIAAANVANLMLTRATAREHELAVRSALGASRMRLAMQLGAETAIITGGGSIAGVLVGIVALHEFKLLVDQILPPWTYNIVPGLSDLHVDLPVLGYVLVLAAVFTLMVGLLPALLQRRNLIASLSSGGNRGAGTRAFARAVLAVTEIALACALLILATLLVHSFVAMSSADPGFDTGNLYEIGIGALPKSRYGAPSAVAAFLSQALQKIRAIPGVTDAASDFLPPVLNDERTEYWLPGHPKSQTPKPLQFNSVSAAYFRTMRIPLLAGRFFTSRDTLQSQSVVIVNASFAKEMFGSPGAALGKQVVIGVSTTTRRFPVRTIVGVAGDTRTSLEDPIRGEVYMPIAQLAWPRSFVVRTDGSRVDLAQAVGTAIRQIDPQLATTGQAVPLSTMLAVSDGDVRASTLMLGTTALVALLLALAGIYAVVAYGVARRTHEFGIRAALGARPATILRGVLGEALRTSAIGIAAGVVLAVPLCYAIASAMPSGTVSAFDPFAFVAVVILLVTATLLAAWIPARRAMRVQPNVALRYE